ncbi:hypothetical protein CRE_22646 [Caenorhabditis remanei]|uniref:Uncharacterized protein n=1 Tax=Caenorhabditis remanei TaxID=31234 RepID=E3N8Q9_CAERE|nr:hypothetical protein CRE_22646 [Caenorhabditis remanei]
MIAITGKCFIMNGSKTRIMEAASDLMEKYSGKMVKWNGTEFSSNPNANYISIPLNDDLVIAIYAVTHREDKWNPRHQIVMKTMPIDAFIPAEDFSEDKTLLEIKMRSYCIHLSKESGEIRQQTILPIQRYSPIILAIMSRELSYPGLKCVLEFLEANKRIHISSRSPSLRLIERSVPLRLDTLRLIESGVKLNKIENEINEDEELTTDDPRSEMVLGDIFMGSETPEWNRNFLVMQFSNEMGMTAERRLPTKYSDPMKIHLATRKMLAEILGRRRVILVDKLEMAVYFSTILRLPVGFQARIKKLYCGNIDIKQCLPLIDPASYPLEELDIRNLTTLNLPIIQTCEKLLITERGDIPENLLNDLLRLSHKNAKVWFWNFHADTFHFVIQHWMTNGQGNAVHYEMGSENESSRFLEEIKQRYDGRTMTFARPAADAKNVFDFVSIPLNNSSHIVVYPKNLELPYDYQSIAMKVMPIGTFASGEHTSNSISVVNDLCLIM